jgi:hypothetical protein
MKVLDSELDNKPTEKAVAKMAESRIRNLQCFEELQSFNTTGKWRNVHPLLTHYSERFKLEDLRRKDPEEFLKRFTACSNNIKRYKSYLNNPNRENKRENDKNNLVKHQEMKIIFEDILKNEGN